MPACPQTFPLTGKYKEIAQNSINLRKEEMKKLQVLQNSSLRLLLKKKYDTPTSILLEEARALSVNQTVAMNMLSQVWKIQECHQPVYHYERLFGRLAEPNTSTRSISSKEASVNFNLSQGRGSFFYQAAILWNNLPPGVKNSSSKQQFKSRGKPWVQRNIPIKI